MSETIPIQKANRLIRVDSVMEGLEFSIIFVEYSDVLDNYGCCIFPGVENARIFVANHVNCKSTFVHELLHLWCYRHLGITTFCDDGEAAIHVGALFALWFKSFAETHAIIDLLTRMG